MKKKTKKGLISALCCGILTTAAIGLTATVTGSADSVRVKPTGTNTATLTAPINDAELDTFKVKGASTRTSEPNGFRFLATIEQSDLALIPNDAEFGMLIIPNRLLGDSELTETTANALVAPAKIDTGDDAVPENGLGYRITLMGETLDEAFPQNLYGTVLAARAYVKYTYEANGETVTDYAYSGETLYRSIAYVASCELVDLENKGTADTNAESFLNKIIADQTQNAVLGLSETAIKVGQTATVTLENATDGVNAFAYNLHSSNEEVAVINANGEVEAVGTGNATITAKIGAKEVSATLTVQGAVAFESGNILYSTKDNTIFMPDGLLDEGETVVSAIDTNGEDYFNRGKWTAMALTDAEITANTARETTLTVETSNGDLYTVKAISYAGVIDELNDFPTFFNTANDTNAAVNTYGYYVVIKNLDSPDTVVTMSHTTGYGWGNSGFLGVLDGMGHTVSFKLKGYLLNNELGNCLIKNISLKIKLRDKDEAEFDKDLNVGVLADLCNRGTPVIENTYFEILGEAPRFAGASTWYLMARSKTNLVLRNVVVQGVALVANNASTDTAYQISANSENAFVIWGRTNSDTWGQATNFDEVSTTGAITHSGLSEFDSAYWTTTDNKPSWKTASDLAVSVYDEKYVEVIEEKALYSTADGEMILPDSLAGATIVDAYSKDMTVDYYEGGVWSNLAVSTTSNETKETTMIIETSDGYFYQVTATSYAGVIDELSDFPVFFNNEATADGYAPETYGHYIVTKDLGDGTDELAFTQCATINWSANCGFSGILDGQGHTLRFKLTSGGLVGMLLGNATIKNLGVIFEDATTTKYGVFGYFTRHAPTIENCYIEQTNNHFGQTTTFGIMARPNGRLVLKNTVVYGFNISMNNNSGAVNISTSSANANAYVIHGRAGANDLNIAPNFTKIFNDGLEDGSRDVLLSEIADASGFNNYWYKENGKLIWKGLETVNVTWVNGETTTVEPFTKGDVMSFPTLEDAYWSKTEGGKQINVADEQTVTEDRTYYAVSTNRYIEEKAYYSTVNNELLLPTQITDSISSIETITSADGETVYYENSEWHRNFALTSAQITANETTATEIKIYDGTSNYFVTVHSYAGVIDELNDFPTFFNTANDTNAAVNTYGYYVVIKNLDSPDTVVTMSHTTGYGWGNSGFLGVLDGMGHTVSCTLKGYLLNNELGSCTIKNISLQIKLVAAGEAAGSVSGNVGILADLCNTGTPTIENAQFVVLGEVPTYSGFSCWYIMARPKGNLVLKNVVVQADLTKAQAATDYQISANSDNAFIVWARAAMVSSGQATNFDEVSSSDAITHSGLSELDSAYWTTTDNKPSWKTAADAAVTSVGTVSVELKNLAENGVTEYVVIMPDNADENVQLAQTELISFFAEATGATLSVAEDGAYSSYDTIISIGYTDMYKTTGLSVGDVSGQGYRIQTQNNSIFINSTGSLGCVYGVYGLLNELFGYEQFSADCYTLDDYKAATVALPTLDILDNPDFEIRNPVSGAVTADDTYAMRIRMADKQYILPLGDYRYNNGAGWRTEHNVFEILPPDYWKEQGKTNWFSDDGTQLCYTAHGNSDDYTAMVAQIVDAISLTLGSDTFLSSTYAEAKYITISGEDGDGVCTCSACAAAKTTYGTNAGAAIKLCNDVREGIETWMNNNPKYKRDITLLFLAYNAYFDAPVTLDETTGKYEFNGGLTLRSDVGIWLAGSSYAQYYYDINDTENADFKEAFQKWVDVTYASGSPLCLWTYSLNNNEYMIHADMYGEGKFYNESAYQYFASKGVDMYYNQGPWNATTTVTAFNRLNIYLDSQLMWDSEQSVTELTDKYFNAMYGAGASYMKQLYDAENAASRELFDPDIVGVPNDQTNSFESWFGVLSSSNINTWLGYIDSAKSAVKADANLTDPQKSAYIDRINEEWIAVKYWQMRYHGSSIKEAAKAEFREVLGYDSTTKTYAKDVTLGERYTYTLTEWIENDFSEPNENL